MNLSWNGELKKLSALISDESTLLGNGNELQNLVFLHKIFDLKWSVRVRSRKAFAKHSEFWKSFLTGKRIEGIYIP